MLNSVFNINNDWPLKEKKHNTWDEKFLNTSGIYRSNTAFVPIFMPIEKLDSAF